MQGLELPKRVFPCATPAEVRATLPKNEDVLAFQCRNPIHRCARRRGGRSRLGVLGGGLLLCARLAARPPHSPSSGAPDGGCGDHGDGGVRD